MAFGASLRFAERQPDMEADPLGWHLWPDMGKEPAPLGEGDLRFGITLSDGRSWWSDEASWDFAQTDGAEVNVYPRKVSASADSQDSEFWLAPLPPAGPVLFEVTWPDQGIDLETATLDGDELRRLANESWRLWD